MKTPVEALQAVYDFFGPKTVAGGVCQPLPAADYAKMTQEQVSASYDFYGAELMHEVAATLAATPPPRVGLMNGG